MNGRITTELDGFSLSLSNLDKPLFPDGFTKGELMSYYLEIAEVLLPHLDGRPLTRVRFPDGTAGESFYEKNAPAGAPEFVRTVDVATSAGTVRYVTATRRADLAWLANLAAIELHTPQWRAQEATAGPHGIRLDGDDEPLATSLIVDLDPGPGVAAPDLARGAILAATTLADVGLESHCKTSGNKGLQLTVPIAPTPASEVYDFALALARRLARQHRDLFVATMAKDARAGRIFLDFAQNLAARNTVHAYSVRGLTVPSVATPLTWDEVAALRETVRTHPAEMIKRISELGDLWDATLPTDANPQLPSGDDLTGWGP